MDEEKKEERSLADELGRFGQQVAAAIKSAWESPDRKKLQAEFTEGLKRFGEEVTVALDKASESETAEKLRGKADEVVKDLRESEVVDDIRDGLITGLQSLNKEIGKLRERLDAPAAGSAPAAEPPQEPKPEA